MIDLILGLCLGYLIVTLCKSFYHRVSGHATHKLRQLCPKLGSLGHIILDRWYSHYVIHHCTTFKHNYVTQFSSRQEQLACTEKLESENNHHIVAQSFGLRVVDTPIDYFSYMAPTVPFIMVLCCFNPTVEFILGALVPLAIMPLMSEFIHPLLHMDYQIAQQQAHPILKPILKTRYFKYLAHHHWLHHRHPKYNFNLMLGGDWLFGCHRKATTEEITEMKALGLP